MKLNLKIKMASKLKGELQCKTTQKEVKEGLKTIVSSVLVSSVEPPLKEISLTIAEILKKVVLLAHRSAQKRKRIARSLGWEGNRIVRSFGWEGNTNTCRCRGKGIESSSFCIVNYS